MTFLDDFEAKYKLQGVITVREVLLRLPKGLLKRTGVDGLIQQVFSRLFPHTHSQISVLTVSPHLPGSSPKF